MGWFTKSKPKRTAEPKVKKWRVRIQEVSPVRTVIIENESAKGARYRAKKLGRYEDLTKVLSVKRVRGGKR